MARTQRNKVCRATRNKLLTLAKHCRHAACMCSYPVQQLKEQCVSAHCTCSLVLTRAQPCMHIVRVTCGPVITRHGYLTVCVECCKFAALHMLTMSCGVMQATEYHLGQLKAR
jgi:hypothetical protein